MMDLGSISILKVSDTTLEFYDDLKEELVNSGMDNVGKIFIHYPRLDLCKMIFKVSNMESVFTEEKKK